MKRRGAAMIWACLLLLIGSLIVGTLTTLGISYHTRSMDEAKINQAYLTARSGAEAVSDSIKNQTPAGKDIAKSVRENNIVTINDMKFDTLDTRMGKCSVTITPDSKNTNIPPEKKKDGRFTISSTATITEMVKGKEERFTKTVDIVMQETKSGGKLDDLFLGADEDIEAGSSVDLNTVLKGENTSGTVKIWDEDVYGVEMEEIKAPNNCLPLDANNVWDVGSSDGTETYYAFKKGINQWLVLNPKYGSGNIYMFVKDGITVNLSTALRGLPAEEDENGKPLIKSFIFVEDGGTLNLDYMSLENYLYIYTKSGTVNIRNNGIGKWYGGITIEDEDDVKKVTGNVDIIAGRPAEGAFSGAGGSIGGGSGYKYSVENYGD